MSLESIYSHDILPSSVIFEGDLTSKPNKSKLLAEIEKHLAHEDMAFPCADAAVILDFMSKIRSFTNLSSFGTFAKAITCVLSAGQSVCFRTSLHIIFDSYLETSVKEGERIRRTACTGAVDMALIGPEVPYPNKWKSSGHHQVTRLNYSVSLGCLPLNNIRNFPSFSVDALLMMKLSQLS